MKPTPEDQVVIHILRAGLPLCRFSYETPMNWAAGHLWVNEHDSHLANCAGCRSYLTEEREGQKGRVKRGKNVIDMTVLEALERRNAGGDVDLTVDGKSFCWSVAGMILAIYKALNPRNKEKYISMSFDEMEQLAWEAVDDGVMKLGWRSR